MRELPPDHPDRELIYAAAIKIQANLGRLLEAADLDYLDKNTWYRTVASLCTTLADTASTAARITAVRGVEENAMSRKLAGEILGVHQGTIARWLKEGTFGKEDISNFRDRLPGTKVLADETIDSDSE